MIPITKLGVQKGYRLVGCERYGYNAFFVRADLGKDILPAKTPSECFRHPFAQYISGDGTRVGTKGPWVEVC
jgi:hypothetical protein